MKLSTLVWRELCARPTTLIAAALTIVLSVGALVAIRHITTFSERAIGRQLEQLGANVLVLPQGTTLQDYYSADLSDRTLPESHASTILLANLSGVDRLSPRLCVSTSLGNRGVTVTGILPQSEFEANAAWQSVGVFAADRTGCGRANCNMKELDASPEALASQRSIQQLGSDEIVIGADVAEFAKLAPGARVELWDNTFKVVAVLPPTGTIDDSRVYAHLHTVQQLTDAGEVVNAIEVIGCCDDAATGLVPQLSTLLPDAKVVTVSQVVATQVGVNQILRQISLMVFAVLIVVGGATLAGTISANVRERRREVGTLMALGASPWYVARLFLWKALWLGAGGALIGSVLGVATAMALGSFWAGLVIVPLPELIFAAILTTLVVSACAAYLPARTAAKLDPCVCFQEV
ncbi:MAG: ABC transporter permease [Pirellulales bacterium]|nr:ABC transporter permease [Pirellulales bacterium]